MQYKMSKESVSKAVFGLFILDTIMLFLQCIYYHVQLYQQNVQEAAGSDLREHSNLIGRSEESKIDKQTKAQVHSPRDHDRELSSFKERELKINNDIYSFAFAALIDPNQLGDPKQGYMEPI